jgi:hypothetical protein
VAPERFPGWAGSFADRHGELTAEPGPEELVLRAADGAVAECHVPFPPMPVPSGGDPAALATAAAAHAAAARTVGVLLVRLGGYAAGVFAGSPPVLVASKTGSRLVHGRSAAGGWSQQRFARRREKQAAGALGAAADAAVRVLGPYLGPDRPGQPGPQRASRDAPAGTGGRLDAVVLGGDRRAIAGVSRDPRLAAVLELAVDRFLTVPDPRLAVLRDCPRLFRAIRVLLTGPA